MTFRLEFREHDGYLIGDDHPLALYCPAPPPTAPPITRQPNVDG